MPEEEGAIPPTEPLKSKPGSSEFSPTHTHSSHPMTLRPGGRRGSFFWGEEFEWKGVGRMKEGIEVEVTQTVLCTRVKLSPEQIH